jgi:hypothetical protein
MANRLAWFISAVLVLAWSPASRAQLAIEDIWSAAGLTGIVDEEDRNIYQFNTTGSVSMKASVVSGTLDIRFPVHTMPAHDAPPGACTELRALLRDTGPGVRVLVRVMQLGIRSGFDGQLTRLGEIDTNRTPRMSRFNEPQAYAQYRTCLNVPSGRPFDFEFFTYYVDAQLIKTAEGGNPGPGLMAVQICHTEEQCEP